MEADAARRIWARSLEKYAFRYTTILSDGDASTFAALTQLDPYGPEHVIVKLDCLNHAEKRMGCKGIKTWWMRWRSVDWRQGYKAAALLWSSTSQQCWQRWCDDGRCVGNIVPLDIDWCWPRPHEMSTWTWQLVLFQQVFCSWNADATA